MYQPSAGQCGCLPCKGTVTSGGTVCGTSLQALEFELDHHACAQEEQQLVGI